MNATVAESAVDSITDARHGTGAPDYHSIRIIYRTHVDVLRVRGRIVVVGAPDAPETGIGDTDHLHDHAEGRTTR